MKRRLYINSITSLVYQTIVIISGLIIPRLILVYYGSAINGLVQSITQMLSVISMLDLGVGAVVQAALYKPFADRDYDKVTVIISAAQKYFRIIARCLVGYVVFLVFFYGFVRSNDNNFLTSTGIIVSVAMGYFAQYYFGICNTMLLNSDQKVYVSTIINLFTLVISTIVSIALIVNGASIQFVKLFSSIIFLARPIFLSYYAKKNYNITMLKGVSLNVIPNKWSGLAQHVATILTASIDNILLTIFSTFQAVSVYNVYVMPLNAVRNMIEVTSTGYKSFFGNLIAKEDVDILESEFDTYETFMHLCVTMVFTSILVVLIPFVLLYTKGIKDVDYYDLSFCVSITIAYTMYTLRLIYSNVIFAAGKFKETQKYCIIECIINLVVSLSLVIPLGLTGVAIGTCLSSGYRMIASACYLKKDILFRSNRKLIKHIVVDAVCVIISVVVLTRFNVRSDIVLHWFFDSIVVFIICVVICISVHCIFYREFLSVLATQFKRFVQRNSHR